MSSVLKYFSGLFTGIKSLLIGMSVTWKELWTKKVTQQYPENRDTLVISDRFRCELTMPHDENNEHACTACGICEMNCPNGTITVNFKMIETEDGKKKKILDTYKWDLGMCTFCNLCVLTCPSNAIKFENTFENAVFTRDKLKQQLNHEGSKMREKKKVEKPVTPVTSPKPPVSTPEVNAETPAVEVKAPAVPVVKAEQPIATILASVKESKTETPVEEKKATVTVPKVNAETPIATILASVKESKTEAPKVAPKVPTAESEAKAETTEN